MEQTTLTSSVETPVELKLDWIQDCNPNDKVHDKWFVNLPLEHPASPMIQIEWVSRGALELGVWHATILNSFVIELELSLWQVETVKYRSEQALFKAASSLYGLLM